MTRSTEDEEPTPPPPRPPRRPWSPPSLRKIDARDAALMSKARSRFDGSHLS